MQAERGAAGERRPLERARDAVLVEPVPALVHGREEAVEVVVVVARRQPDVVDRARARERMHCRVEPPRLPVEAEALQHVQLEPLLGLAREEAVASGSLAVLRGGCDERDLLLLQPGEDRADLGRRRPALEVVEEDVVGLVVVVEALDVAAAELEVRLEVWEEGGEVGAGARVGPDRERERRGARHRGPELRRNAPGLLPVLPGDADEARFVGVVGPGGLETLEPVEQATGLGVGEELVGEPVERGDLLGADAAAARGHLDLLVPGEDRAGLLEILDRRQALLQLQVGRIHRARA